MSAEELISLLKLQPLPIEGGYYRETWRSSESAGGKNLGTAIYYLLTAEPNSFSALHSLPADEVYHFYFGDAVELLLLGPAGQSRRIILGSDIKHGEHVQFVVPAGTWQGSRLRQQPMPVHGFALLGTTMSPGFDAADYLAGSRADLTAQYPDDAALIASLTRS